MEAGCGAEANRAFHCGEMSLAQAALPGGLGRFACPTAIASAAHVAE